VSQVQLEFVFFTYIYINIYIYISLSISIYMYIYIYHRAVLCLGSITSIKCSKLMMLTRMYYGLGFITSTNKEIVSVYYAYVVRCTFFQNQCSKKNFQRFVVETISTHIIMA